MKKICRGMIFLIWFCIAFLISSSFIINVNAETSKINFDEFDKLNGSLIHDENYPNMSTVKSGNSLLYTYTVGEEVFTSEKSEDDAWRKAMSWQYEQGIKTLEEIEFEYGLYFIFNE